MFDIHKNLWKIYAHLSVINENNCIEQNELFNVSHVNLVIVINDLIKLKYFVINENCKCAYIANKNIDIVK